jgi:hypothetical protein
MMPSAELPPSGKSATPGKPDIGDLINQMGGKPKYNDARTALTSKYNTFALDTTTSFRLKLPQGVGFANQAIAIVSRLKDDKGASAVPKERIAAFKKGVDSVKSPDPRISERVSEMPILVWKLPGRPEGDESSAPLGIATLIFDRHIELLFEQACMELSPLVEELHDLLVNLGVLEWELKTADDTNVAEKDDAFGQRLNADTEEL